MVVALVLGALAAVAPAGEPKWGSRMVATEIREQIAAVRQAVADTERAQDNIEEICFRVGALYLSARRELEEATATNAAAPAREKKLAGELIKDSRSLPSFCGDGEKVRTDPGYEQVKKGDVANLSRELANMDRRAAELAAGS